MLFQNQRRMMDSVLELVLGGQQLKHFLVSLFSFFFVCFVVVSFVSSFFPLYLARERVHRVKKSTLKTDACVWAQGPTWWKEKNDPFLAVLWPLHTPTGKCTCSHIHRLFFSSYSSSSFSFFFFFWKVKGWEFISLVTLSSISSDAKKKEEENIKTPHLPFSLESKVGESCVFPNLSIPIVILQVSSC